MPPKKPAAVSDVPPVPSSSDSPPEEKAEKKSDAATVRKLSAHPSTAIMVRDALKELDSGKGVSSQAIQTHIKQKYPTVDLVRLKHLVRRALKKGIENGTLVRPAKATATTGATGKFRLAPKVKEPKPKSENNDPNVQKVPKTAKDASKETKTKKTGTTKKKAPAKEEPEPLEKPKVPKKSKKGEEVSTSKVAPAKKPKAKKAAENGDGEGAADSVKTDVSPSKEAKGGKRKAAKKGGSNEPAPKATGKRVRKSAD